MHTKQKWSAVATLFLLVDAVPIAFAPGVYVRRVRLIKRNYNMLTEGFSQTEHETQVVAHRITHAALCDIISRY